ncbi:F-box domain containing protein [Tanacetum coccineum]
MVVLWNPSIRKCVGIVIPNVDYSPYGGTVVGFGVCSDTSDPKLVKIKKFRTRNICWEVQVFTLSSRVWKTVYIGAPFKSCDLMLDHVFIDGIIYWRTLGSFIISFDLKSEKLGEVCLPERLVGTKDLLVAKVEGKSVSAFNGTVLGFRNNGEVVLNMVDDDYKESTVEVYEPSSGHMNGVGIKGDYIKFFATSYMETLLLLDESNSIIH